MLSYLCGGFYMGKSKKNKDYFDYYDDDDFDDDDDFGDFFSEEYSDDFFDEDEFDDDDMFLVDEVFGYPEDDEDIPF